LSIKPLKSLPVGIVVQRTKAESKWVDYLWRAVTALSGAPDAEPWTKLSDDGNIATFYIGSTEIGLFVSDTGQYRDNLHSGSPRLWVTLRPTGSEPPFELWSVTADSSEGESMATSGQDQVDTVPMPDDIADALAQFVAEHHIERVFYKRKRDRANPEALGQRPMVQRKDK
jgi:hypothetical protein